MNKIGQKCPLLLNYIKQYTRWALFLVCIGIITLLMVDLTLVSFRACQGGFSQKFDEKSPKIVGQKFVVMKSVVKL